ncbi:DNRLRE domain-containing protein [Prauserella endophytica]|uniref:DNRLRE domain-containing protein n=1 Tax=Prauserella endophytica TaxID=1592324 RepID=A0ABY2RSU2_9PSEU|nr:DNRLRE domain-containing protein [Prauserella endophytica]TKG58902.1 DNRLRE domain-containing protein [Prauserella endophytica]
MPTNSSRASYDTLIYEAQANTNYGDWNLVTVCGGTGQRRYSFLYFPGIPPSGSTITSAKLRVWLQGSGWSGGPHTITARRVTDTWKESLLTWNRANGSAVPLMGSTTNPGSANVTGGVDKQLVEIDVSLMLADIAAGTKWYGIRLEVNTNDTVARRLYSSEASDPSLRPQLVVEWNQNPLAPVDMAPSGGRSVSVAKPVLKWVFKDREGDQQAEFQVQISTTSTVNSSGAFPTPEFDSGWIASSNSQLDLATTAYAGLTDGATRYWIVRTRDVPGLVSPWSAVQSFRRDTKGTLTLTSPLNGGTVDETTPPITSTLTGRTQEAISYSLSEVTPTGQLINVWNLGRFAAPAADGVPFTFNIPAGKITKTGQQYRLAVQSWDTIDRENIPGDPGSQVAQATFTFVRSATPAPVTTLTVTDEAPGVKLTFNRAAGQGAPDYFCLVVDGVRVADRIDPTDFSLGGNPIVYSMVWYGANANTEHTFEVEAVVLDGGVYKHSQSNATQTHTVDLTEVGGTWLVDDFDTLHVPADLPRRVRIRGAEVPDLEVGESSGTFYPIGRRDPVYIVDAIRGMEGPVSGVVEAEDPAGSDFIENFEWMKREENVGRRYRLIFGDINIPVQLGKAKNTHLDSHLRRRQVSVDVAQVGEFPE